MLMRDFLLVYKFILDLHVTSADKTIYISSGVRE